MLKGLDVRASAAQAKLSGLAARRSVVPFTSARTKPAYRSVRVFAAEGEAAPAPAPAPAAGGKERRAPRQVTVDLATVKPGDVYEGTVTNVSTFGAFVNIGAEKDGLVHISQLSDGFVKSAQEIVKVGQKVSVRVLTLDASSGKIALSMKGMGGAGSESAPSGSGGRRSAPSAFREEEESGPIDMDDEDDDDVGFAAVAEEEEVVLPEAGEGQSVVYGEDVPGFENVPFILDDAETDALTDQELADLEAADDDDITLESELLPYLAVVNGKVSRIEDNFLMVEFEHNGKKREAMLRKDELKVPFLQLSEQEQTAIAEEAAEGADPNSVVLLPKYVDIGDEFTISQYYKLNDELEALVLDGGLEENDVLLTHFTDADVDADGIAEGEVFDEDEYDPLAEDPEALIADEAEEDGDEQTGLGGELGEDGEPKGDLDLLHNPIDGTAVMGGMTAGSLLLTSSVDRIVSFPSRPVVAPYASELSSVKLTDTDFDGDKITLNDFWASDLRVPKNALKRMGLKIEINAQGEPEVVKRDDVPEDAELPVFDALSGDLEERVNAFVADLLDDDVDEAEVPALAGRRPIVLAMAVANISAATVKQLRDKTGAGMMDCKKALGECEGDMDKAVEWLRKKGLSGADKKAGRVAAEGAIVTYIHPGSRLGVLLEVNCETDFVAASDKFQQLVGELGMIIAASPDVQVVRPEDVPAEVLAKETEVEMGKEDIKSKPEAVRAKIVAGRVEKIKNNLALLNQASLRDPTKTVSEIVKETIAAIGENVQIRRFAKYKLGEGIEKKSNDFAAEVAQQTQAKAPEPKKVEAPKEEKKPEAPKATVQVSAAVVKQLRDKTGAGMMDCKKALAEEGGDMDKAVEWLRKKGLSGADKKMGRVAAEGAIVSYIHPGSRLGVLMEVNCETDFVASSDKFQALINAVALTAAASPGVQYISAEDIPAEVFAREKEIEMGREDLKSKPDAIRAKIAEGRAQKIVKEQCLLEQPYLVDTSKTVAEAIKEGIAAIGEKISVRRFVKFQLGEGLEKKSNDFAAEVAAATGKA